MSSKSKRVNPIVRPRDGLHEAALKRKVRRHLKTLGFGRNADGSLVPIASDKDSYRTVHKEQRDDRLLKNDRLLKKSLNVFLTRVADGREVRAESISPRLELVNAGTAEADLFRLASMTWSIPVSDGFGRRLKFLVWDEATGKLMGIFALGDPVFNLRVRDRLVDWTAADRKDRLVNVLDAFVLGALPPYNGLLCGKLVACLIKTREVEVAFRKKYGASQGIISGEKKNARLALVTTTSAMGRSSVYNRLKIGEHRFFESIGFTEGYGHFHLPDKLFSELRQFLIRVNDPYAKNNRFGQGPNWKMRVVRKAFVHLGLQPELLHHGFKREVFSCQLASNALQYLRGEQKRPNFRSLQSVSEVAQLCLDRWVIPRSLRRPEFRAFRPTYLEQTMKSGVAWRLPQDVSDACGNQHQD